ncbi:fungal-specific transcription factor domain-containing protein [Hypoxylon trugodes]|uniref:fungal-specific transcription factor domain-containing protein n=1 Tax=Hypoxylon trugodes TaxID=326681 RepID=UPI002194D46A|nr:fungal-specific transcription factor domain-containing protein [Hypoxylon trugodes]KAI1390969.1 fungal-specific transcription factor domain-containing protein [Hypoxylon trugodes]
MQSDSPNGSGSSGAEQPPAEASIGNGPSKRTRVLLSCAPCRNSKLKCDRATPCGQCLRKGKPDNCLYAPRPEKKRPAKSMAARLKRLEGMVRGMIDLDTSIQMPPVDNLTKQGQSAGLLVQSEKATSYIGATHSMAILEDIEDLKSYFEDADEDDEEAENPHENIGPPELLLNSRGVPRNKEGLLALLPDKPVVIRLMNRYFNSNSPSQHIVHVPTFLKEYNDFCKDPAGTSLHWIALLYMILALGVFFSSFSAPHELVKDSNMPAMDRFKQYRGACGWALIWGKYSQPSHYTIQAFLLYLEGDFVTNRENRMNCYLLSAVLLRLMLKMGLHRDPSKLPNITPYHGEMRRRIWNLAIQLDLLISFNLGLPCMTHAIESDTELPTHLMDSDFDKDTKVLPPARPSSEYTPLTYPINKAAVSRAFFLVVQQAHALSIPTYSEVMKIDARIQEAWEKVPEIMKMRPMDESVMDPPILVFQRFGLVSIHLKSRCILHRRYLVDAEPKREHDFSRKTCLDAALGLLEYQKTMHEASRPGGMLSQNGWFVAAPIHDFLLADMVVALVIQNDKYWETDGEFNWIARCMPTITREGLFHDLKTSYTIWGAVSGELPEFKKAEEAMGTMIRRIERQLGFGTEDIEMSSERTNGSGETASMANLSIGYSGPSTASSSNEPTAEDFAGFNMAGPNMIMPDAIPDQMGSDGPWAAQDGYGWNYFDAMAHSGQFMEPTTRVTREAWADEKTMEGFTHFLGSDPWNFAPS